MVIYLFMSDKPAAPTAAAAPASASFAEALITDALNPGVRPQSFQALNYVFGALLVTSVIAAYLNSGSIHIFVLIGLTSGLAFLINRYKDDFLEASLMFEEQQRAAEAKALEDEAAALAAEEEDEDEEEDAGEEEVMGHIEPDEDEAAAASGMPAEAVAEPAADASGAELRERKP